LNRERGALLNSVAPLVGMAVGALGTGALVQFGPAPTKLVFELFLVVFALQAVVAGLGFGAAFNGSLHSLVPLAEPHERAGLMSTYLVVSYLAFSVPSLLAGFAVWHYGLEATSLGYGAALVAMAVSAIVMMARRSPG
jgi:MFS family permease